MEIHTISPDEALEAAQPQDLVKAIAPEDIHSTFGSDSIGGCTLECQHPFLVLFAISG